MEEGMEELYIEGLAIHGDRKPCVGVREGVGEASVAARAGQVLSRVITEFGVPTLSTDAEGNTACGAIREPLVGPARSETLCMYGTSMRENREVPRSPIRVISGRAAQGRPRPHA
jgi:hypothetical protein